MRDKLGSPAQLGWGRNAVNVLPASDDRANVRWPPCISAIQRAKASGPLALRRMTALGVNATTLPIVRTIWPSRPGRR